MAARLQFPAPVNNQEKTPKPPLTAEAAPDLVEPVDWRVEVPALSGRLVSLREVQAIDAPVLVDLLSTPEVSRFISTPPETAPDFQRYVSWAVGEREAGHYIAFAIVPHEAQRPVGMAYLREIEPRFATAEWGFALGMRYWGSGYFMDAARQLIDFAFGTVGVHRLEARAAMQNARCNNALQKIGAVREAVLRRAFLRHGEYLDQALWTIVDEDWEQAKMAWGLRIH
jgi:ribosomal-protein-alanine N-acetyltransferase